MPATESSEQGEERVFRQVAAAKSPWRVSARPKAFGRVNTTVGCPHAIPRRRLPPAGGAATRRLGARRETRWYLVLPAGLVLLGVSMMCASVQSAPYDAQRARLIREIAADVEATRDYLGFATLDERVTSALARVRRDRFVPIAQRSQAYANRPLPIGYGQTISQPYIVAIMTHLVQPDADDVIFELGTGSGYQAAVLAELVRHVYSMEIIEALGTRARQTLHAQGYDNVEVRVGDGYNGWQEHAPFDGIVVTAASDHIPPPLVRQLKPGGRMVIPVGSPFLTQELVVVTKLSDGAVRTRKVLPVRFVPLTGSH